MPKILKITFKKETGNDLKCIPDREFQADPGDPVTFVFQGTPEEVASAEIRFLQDDSPFHDPGVVTSFKPTDGPKTVRANPTKGRSYGYVVTWKGARGPGHGNGGGSVPPSDFP